MPFRTNCLQMIEVLQWLQEGDQVVVNGQINLMDGEGVMVVGKFPFPFSYQEIKALILLAN